MRLGTKNLMRLNLLMEKHCKKFLIPIHINQMKEEKRWLNNIKRQSKRLRKTRMNFKKIFQLKLRTLIARINSMGNLMQQIIVSKIIVPLNAQIYMMMALHHILYVFKNVKKSHQGERIVNQRIFVDKFPLLLKKLNKVQEVIVKILCLMIKMN